MPNRWETSARPLFVKTVFVNGNRHAILFEKDPLLRCGKKISRPNSSLSFASDFSISFSDSQNSSSESKDYKTKPLITQRKDLSAELQSCLVKLKLASSSLDIQENSTDEKCNPKELKWSQSKEKRSSKQKRRKWNYETICKRKHREQFYVETNEHNLGERKNDPENCCYVYNLENYRGKKKYCFVKISSQPPQFILNCCCEKNWNESHNRNLLDKNNLVISATIHNLVMSSNGHENILQKTFDYIFPFQNAELDWNNYLTKSYYNSLSDRVFQWLDLARRRQKKQEKSTDEDDTLNRNAERIFSGETFVGDKKDISSRQESRIFTNKRMERNTVNNTEEDVDGEVAPEPYVETLLSADKLTYQDCVTDNKPAAESQTQQQNPNNKENLLTGKITNKNGSLLPQTESPLKIQDLLLNFDLGSKIKRKTKEYRNVSPLRNKLPDKESKEPSVKTINSWQKRLSEEDVTLDKIDAEARCQYNRNLDDFADKIKNLISTEEFAERNKKSINNLNITRTKPVLIQNLLSPQQPGKISFFEEDKIVWGSEKNTGRPQLHIFMPSILPKDQSDDSLSECESFLNL